MSPYDVLGISPMADLDEAEAAYRRLLRLHHPDLHHGDGPDALAAGEARTRALNAAIRQIRGEPSDAVDTGYSGYPGYSGRTGHTGPYSGANDAAYARRADEAQREPSEGRDLGDKYAQQWAGATSFADPPPVAMCPFCDDPFANSRAMKLHVAGAHGVRIVAKPRRAVFRSGVWTQVRRLRHVPIWYLLPFNVLIAMLAALAVAPLDVQFAYWVFAVAMAPTFALFLAHGRNGG